MQALVKTLTLQILYEATFPQLYKPDQRAQSSEEEPEDERDIRRGWAPLAAAMLPLSPGGAGGRLKLEEAAHCASLRLQFLIC